MNSTFKTLLLSALALPAMGVLNNTASAQSLLPPSLSAARRICMPAIPPAPHYIPGHYELIRERVLIPGSTYRVFVPGRYRTHCRGPFGRPVTRYRSGHYELRREPDRFEYRNRKIWVPGRYSY